MPPAQRPQDSPPGGWRLPGPGAVCRALLRALAARAAHRAARPVAAVPDGIAQGRADLQFTHHAGHGASEGDPDL